MFETLKKSKQISVIALDRMGDYMELLRLELRLQARELVMQVAGYMVALFFGVLTAIFAGLATMATFWDTPYRVWAAWGVVVVYGVLALIGVLFGRKHVYHGSAISTLREEMKRDADLVKENL